jgi:arylformamidase
VNDAWRHFDAATLAREYSPSSMVESVGDEIARYVSASDIARLRWPPTVVGYGAHESESIDVFVPDAAALRAVLVYVHGGYWQELTKHESAFMAPALLTAGIAVAVVDYELAPARPVHGIIEQVAAATQFVCDNAVVLGLGAAPVIVAGSSAGAHLAAWAAARERRVAGAVLLSGVYDLRPLVTTYINDALGMDDARAAACSVEPSALSCPVVVAVGGIETGEFRRQSHEFAAALRERGRNVSMVDDPARHHFDLPFDLGERRTPLGEAVATLISQVG